MNIIPIWSIINHISYDTNDYKHINTYHYKYNDKHSLPNIINYFILFNL